MLFEQQNVRTTWLNVWTTSKVVWTTNFFQLKSFEGIFCCSNNKMVRFFWHCSKFFTKCAANAQKNSIVKTLPASLQKFWRMNFFVHLLRKWWNLWLFAKKHSFCCSNNICCSNNLCCSNNFLCCSNNFVVRTTPKVVWTTPEVVWTTMKIWI